MNLHFWLVIFFLKVVTEKKKLVTSYNNVIQRDTPKKICQKPNALFVILYNVIFFPLQIFLYLFLIDHSTPHHLAFPGDTFE